MADPTRRDEVLRWWASHRNDSAAQVAQHFNQSAGCSLKPSTLRQWKSRHGLPDLETEDAAQTESLQAAAVWDDIRSIVPWADNPRENDDSVLPVADSIMRFGYGRTFVAWQEDGERMLVVGHTARKAVLLNLERHPDKCPPGAPAPHLVPVRWRDDWTSPEAKAYAIADNQLATLSGWLDAELARQLRELDGQGLEHTLLGFDGELDDLLAELENTGGGTGTGGGTEGAFDPSLAAEVHSVLGEVYELGPHRLVCGDSTDPACIALALGGRKADGVWTDPPYGVAVNKVASPEEAKRLRRRTDGLLVMNDDLTPEQLEELLRKSLGAAVANMEKGAPMYVASPPGPLIHVFGTVLLELEVWRHTLAWVKDRFALGRADYHGRYESIFYGWKKGAAHPWVAGRDKDTVLEVARPGRSKEHPTMKKPVELVKMCLANHFDLGADKRILEPFGGSGTTMIAAAELGLSASLVELDPRYCDVIRRRWTAFALCNGHEAGPGALAPKTEKVP